VTTKNKETKHHVHLAKHKTKQKILRELRKAPVLTETNVSRHCHYVNSTETPFQKSRDYLL